MNEWIAGVYFLPMNEPAKTPNTKQTPTDTDQRNIFSKIFYLKCAIRKVEDI